jgi:ferredoxin
MITVKVGHKKITCGKGSLLRDVLLKAQVKLYNGPSAIINCRGHGTCGTCAVEITGTVAKPKGIEKIRLALPPHSTDSGLRLACQVKVNHDLIVKKHPGICGQKIK